MKRKKTPILIDLKPQKRFAIPVTGSKFRVMTKYTKHRITTRERDGKCRISSMDGDIKVINDD